MAQYEKYLQNGQKIFDTYCTTNRLLLSIMFPRAPHQKYIDLYPDQDGPGQSFQGDRSHQTNYEAEVKVFRALENLNENLIVIHSAEYTHYQYYLGDSSHDKRQCIKCKKMAASKEGECDFIVIGSKYIVIIEVKNVGGKSEPGPESENVCYLQGLAKSFEKSLQQRRRMVDLIKRFSTHINVHQFTAYPYIEMRFKNEFELNESYLPTIILKENLDDFPNWWKENVARVVLNRPLDSELQKKHEELRNFLLAMWCTDKNGCDMSKCSLGQCIRSIDEKLRSGRFSFRKNNPEVIQTPDIVKEFLGINNLTKEQFGLINSTEKLLWINGPAGTGKTVVLLAKLIQLALASTLNKIVLFDLVGADKSTDQYEKILQNACIEYQIIVIDNPDTPVNTICSEIIRCHLNSQVVIAVRKHSVFLGKPDMMIPKILMSLQGVNLFVDDIQCLHDWNWSESLKEMTGFITKLFELSVTHHICVACDVTQGNMHHVHSTFLYANLKTSLRETFSSSQHVNLMKILRNSFDLSLVLSVIRDENIKEDFRKIDDVDIIFPVQTPGHYIHGPKSSIHVLENFNKDLVRVIFDQELNKLCQDNFIDVTDIGLIYTESVKDMSCLVDDIVKGGLPKDTRFCSLTATYSKEWPAVIILHLLKDHEMKSVRDMLELDFLSPEDRLLVDKMCDLRHLYIAMSRARVKCTVIMFPMSGKTFQLERFHRTRNVLDKIKGLVDIFRYPLC